MKTKLLVIFSVLLLAGCVSVLVPTSDRNTLLTGKFLVNWNTTNKMSGANGTYKMNIEIYFQNNQTGKIFPFPRKRTAGLSQINWLVAVIQSGNFTWNNK
jgi:hypothetical protein